MEDDFFKNVLKSASTEDIELAIADALSKWPSSNRTITVESITYKVKSFCDNTTEIKVTIRDAFLNLDKDFAKDLPAK